MMQQNKQIARIEMAGWELADELREKFNIASYSCTVQTEHVESHNQIGGPVKDGAPAIYLGVMISSEDPLTGKLPLTYTVGDDVVPVRYHLMDARPMALKVG